MRIGGKRAEKCLDNHVAHKVRQKLLKHRLVRALAASPCASDTSKIVRQPVRQILNRVQVVANNIQVLWYKVLALVFVTNFLFKRSSLLFLLHIEFFLGKMLETRSELLIVKLIENRCPLQTLILDQVGEADTCVVLRENYCVNEPERGFDEVAHSVRQQEGQDGVLEGNLAVQQRDRAQQLHSNVERRQREVEVLVLRVD